MRSEVGLSICIIGLRAKRGGYLDDINIDLVPDEAQRFFAAILIPVMVSNALLD